METPSLETPSPPAAITARELVLDALRFCAWAALIAGLLALHSIIGPLVRATSSLF